MEAREFKVLGKVQGVFFRKYTVRKARELGNIVGWVRNLDDGSVKCLAVGSKEKLDRLEEWLHTGSPKARVTKVISKNIDIPDPVPRDFVVLRG